MRALMTANSHPWWTNNYPAFRGRAVDQWDHLDHLFQTFLKPLDSMSSIVSDESKREFSPPCDIADSKDGYQITFDIPGLKKEDIHIEIDESNLVVSGERKGETKHSEEDQFVRQERFWGQFQRVFSLPSTAESQKIQASYTDGVLTILIPKTDKAKKRTIEIQSELGPSKARH